MARTSSTSRFVAGIFVSVYLCHADWSSLSSRFATASTASLNGVEANVPLIDEGLGFLPKRVACPGDQCRDETGVFAEIDTGDPCVPQRPHDGEEGREAAHMLDEQVADLLESLQLLHVQPELFLFGDSRTQGLAVIEDHGAPPASSPTRACSWSRFWAIACSTAFNSPAPASWAISVSTRRRDPSRNCVVRLTNSSAVFMRSP